MKIRVLAILAGLAVDFVGSTLFVVAVALLVTVFGRQSTFDGALTGVTGLLVVYWIGLAFTLFGAYITATLSKPHCVLNTALFGILSTLPSWLFISWYPLWFTLLCVFTIFPLSVAAGRAVAAGTV